MFTQWNGSGRGPRGGRGHGHFGHGRGGFMGRMGGGNGFRAARMLASDDLQLIVLSLLAEKPRHGYELIKAVEELSSGAYIPSPGVIYPALTYLEEMGFAKSEAEGNKKLFQITESGQEQLEKNREIVNRMLEQLSHFGKKMAKMQRHLADEDAETDLEDHHGHRAMKMEFGALRDDLRSVLRDLIDASVEEKKRVQGILKRALDEIRKR